jgi:hypothetical protein
MTSNGNWKLIRDQAAKVVAFHGAVWNLDDELVQYYLSISTTSTIHDLIQSKLFNGTYPIHQAWKNLEGNKNIVAFLQMITILLNNGSNINSQDNNGGTLFYYV